MGEHSSARRCAFPRVLALCALLAPAVQCGGSGTPPTAPSPPDRPPVVIPPGSPPGPPPPTNVRVTAVDNAGRSAIVQWDPSEGADRYEVDYWPAEGPGEIRTVLTAGPETATTLRELPPGWLRLHVKAVNSLGPGASSKPPIDLQLAPALNHIIEALFFGTGLYGTGFYLAPGVSDYFPINQAHIQPGTMLGWRRGAVRVVVEEAVTPAQVEHLRLVFAQVADLTDGDVRPEIVARVANLSDAFAPGELSVMVRHDLSVPCRNQSVVLEGCAPQDVATGGELVAALIYVKPNVAPHVLTHETGHALLGLHHTRGVAFPVRPVMGGGVSDA